MRAEANIWEIEHLRQIEEQNLEEAFRLIRKEVDERERTLKLDLAHKFDTDFQFLRDDTANLKKITNEIHELYERINDSITLFPRLDDTNKVGYS